MTGVQTCALPIYKVLRGGCSLYDERFSRCAARMIMPPHVRDWTPSGFRCVIGPSFGDIFFENCFKNGVLAVVLLADDVAELRRQLHAHPGATISVDLGSQTLTAPDGTTRRFEVDPFRKQALLKGQDEIALTMEHVHEIEAFEARRTAEMPWLAGGGA